MSQQSSSSPPPAVAVVLDERRKGKEEEVNGGGQCPKLHSLPLCLDYTGPAKVSTYFHPKVIGGDPPTMAVAFRGHLLLGQSVEMPEGYTICCVEKGQTKHSEEDAAEVTAFKVTNNLPSMDVWEFDEQPGLRKNSLQNALIALRVAKDLAA